MVLLVAAFLVSLLPSIGLFLWLRKLEGDEEFTGICNKAMIQGLLCILPVVGFSFFFAIVELGLTYVGVRGIAKKAYHCFIVLAFAEETAKYLWFRRLLKKYGRAWSWMDYVILMSIVGIGFGLAEDLPYALGTNAVQMIVRGVTIMHGGYGFFMGYFMGKAEKTGSRLWSVVGFMLPWLLHGFYDFGLSEELLALNDNWAFLSVSLAAFALVTLVLMIVFMLRRKNDARYREPMSPSTVAEQ